MRNEATYVVRIVFGRLVVELQRLGKIALGMVRAGHMEARLRLDGFRIGVPAWRQHTWTRKW